MATPVSAEKWRGASMVALLSIIPDRRRKGSPPLLTEYVVSKIAIVFATSPKIGYYDA